MHTAAGRAMQVPGRIGEWKNPARTQAHLQDNGIALTYTIPSSHLNSLLLAEYSKRTKGTTMTLLGECEGPPRPSGVGDGEGRAFLSIKAHCDAATAFPLLPFAKALKPWGK